MDPKVEFTRAMDILLKLAKDESLPMNVRAQIADVFYSFLSTEDRAACFPGNEIEKYRATMEAERMIGEMRKSHG